MLYELWHANYQAFLTKVALYAKHIRFPPEQYDLTWIDFCLKIRSNILVDESLRRYPCGMCDCCRSQCDTIEIINIIISQYIKLEFGKRLEIRTWDHKHEHKEYCSAINASSIIAHIQLVLKDSTRYPVLKLVRTCDSTTPLTKIEWLWIMKDVLQHHYFQTFNMVQLSESISVETCKIQTLNFDKESHAIVENSNDNLMNSDDTLGIESISVETCKIQTLNFDKESHAIVENSNDNLMNSDDTLGTLDTHDNATLEESNVVLLLEPALPLSTKLQVVNQELSKSMASPTEVVLPEKAQTVSQELTKSTISTTELMLSKQVKTLDHEPMKSSSTVLISSEKKVMTGPKQPRQAIGNGKIIPSYDDKNFFRDFLDIVKDDKNGFILPLTNVNLCTIFSKMQQPTNQGLARIKERIGNITFWNDICQTRDFSRISEVDLALQFKASRYCFFCELPKMKCRLGPKVAAFPN